MAQLVDTVGHLLTPELRDDLRRLNTPGGRGRAVTGNPWIRPYLLTGGRTRTQAPAVPAHAGVGRATIPRPRPGCRPRPGGSTSRAVLGPQSVAELSAHCGMPLGVTRVLLEDLAAGRAGADQRRPRGAAGDQRLLQRVLDGPAPDRLTPTVGGARAAARPE